MIEINLLVKKTIEFLKKNGLNDLNINESPRKKESCWGKICISCEGSHSFKQAQYIKAIWQKNCKNFRNIVIESLNEEEKMICEDQLISRIELNFEEIKKIRSNIGNKPRIYIKKSVIEEILHNKLVNYGIKCQFKCLFNWFSIKKNQNFKWNGKFECILKKLTFVAYFNANIDNDNYLILYLNWIKYDQHEWYFSLILKFFSK